MTAFVTVPAMYKQLVVAIESLSTESTFGMPFETSLIDRAWIVIAKLLVFPQVVLCKQVVLMGEDFLIPGT